MGDLWVRHFDKATQTWYHHNTETGEMKWAGNDDEHEGNDGANHNGNDAENEAVEAVATLAVDEWRRVYIVRTRGGGPVFKHWALYIVDQQGDEYTGFICNIEGRRENYRYVCKKTTDPVVSVTFVDMYQVGYVDTDSLVKLKEFAMAKRVRNEDKFWGCQDWAWEMLEELEEEGLLEHGDEFEDSRAELGRLKGPG